MQKTETEQNNSVKRGYLLMLLAKEIRMQMKETKSFTATNKPWNDLKLNSVNKVGAVMAIIKNSKATTFEEWEDYYLKTGEMRTEKLAAASDKTTQKYNKYYGRTQDDLMQLARRLAAHEHISLQKAFNYVYIRVIDETWTGYERELNVLKQIQTICKSYPNLTASGVDSITDTDYAVDFEIKLNNKPILAIQLKPTSYRDSTNPAVADARRINTAKNDEYTKTFGAPVLYLYTTKTGAVDNMNELFDFLNNLFS